MQSSKNASLIAIMQAGVLTSGVLVSGLWNRILGNTIPPAAQMFLDHGPLVLGIPVVWILGFVYINIQPGFPELLKRAAFWLGPVILAGCVVLVLRASLFPLMNMHWGIAGADAGE